MNKEATVQSMQCDTFTVSGYFTSPGSCFYNIASVTSPANTVWKDSVCVSVINVCNVPNAQQIADSSFSLPMSASYSNASFVLHGRFYVDDTLTLINCHVYAYPGAQIIVLPTGLLTLDGTTIEGCTQMWRGVRLNKNAKIIMRENSIIMDADTGITALHGSAFDLRFSSVINCIVGIAVPKQMGMNNVQGYVNGCKFGLYATAFKPDFSGQNAHHALPRSCMEFNDVVMTIGDKDTNEFRNSNWGIYSLRSDLTVKTCRFRNMVAAGSLYGTTTHKGTAVVAESKTAATAGMITFTNSSIDSCVYGTYTEWTTARVYSINAAHVSAVGSYHLYCNSTGMSTTVNNCNITAGKAGITFQNSERGTMTAAGNAIKVTAGGSSVGINIISTTTNFGNYQILNNPYIEAVNGSGIVANSAKNANVINNLVKLSGNTTNGIALTGCDSSTVSCNTVSGRYPTVSYQNKGINVSHSTNNFMSCNFTDSTYFGNYFEGACNGTRFRGTQMNRHFEGLRLFTNAVIDTQAHAGNLWFGPFTTGGYGANNLNNGFLFNLQQSAFLIDYSYGVNYIPTIPANNTGWIQPQTGNEFDCTGLLLCTDETHERNAATQLQLTIAEDSLKTAEFSDETKIMAKKYLYKDLKENDSLANGNFLLTSFLAANENTATGQLYDVNNAIKEADIIGGVESQTLSMLSSLTDSIIGNIDYLDSLANTDSTLILNNLRDSLVQQLINALQNKTDLLNQLGQVKEQSLINIQSLSNSIITNNTPDEYEKEMNDVEIAYQTGGISELQSRYSQVLAVAVLCPHVGGKAVYKARSFMTLLNDTIEYDDTSVCTQAGYRKAAANEQTKEIKESIRIVPNPASNKIGVELTGIDDGICKIQIRNALNEIVYDSEFNCSEKNHLINVNYLSGGIYSITVNADNKKSLISKLTIVR
ncbi:MAG TPA: hypothetical protein PLX94_11355 [Bacteroidia bacterium]|nr:hypothetical protein [Bacteroidia bacterium]